jgi:hypothetical protein
MALRNRLSRRILLTGAATAATIGVTAGVALAVLITFTITPGGAITATAGTTTLTDTNTGSVLTCTSSTSSGTLHSGSGISGTSLGTISALSFSNCTGPLSLTFTVTNKNFPWNLSGTSYNAGLGGGTTTGFISKIKSVLSGPSCSADVGGTTATSAGKVKVTYTNNTHKLKVLSTGGNLHVWNVSGCAGLINSGDATTFSGVYTVTPKQKIVSP